MRAATLVAVGATCAFCCPAHAELIVAVYTGSSRTRSSDLRVEQAGSDSNAEFRGVHWQARPFDDSPYYGLRVSYFPRQHRQLGWSLDFTHYKMHAATARAVPVQGTWNGSPVDESAPMNTRVQNFEISHGVNLTSLNGDWRWQAEHGAGFADRWQPHVGAGLVAYLPHAEGSINGSGSSGDYQLAGWGYQVFAGTEYRVLGHLSLFVETKFDQGKLNIDLAPAARVATKVRTLHALVGVAWHFQPIGLP